MTNEQLNSEFHRTQTTPGDFIEWARSMGVKVHDATISRHRAGTQGITAPWAIAYKCFFNIPFDFLTSSK